MFIIFMAVCLFMDWDTILQENQKQIFSNGLPIKELWTDSQAECLLLYHSCSGHAADKLQ